MCVRGRRELQHGGGYLELLGEAFESGVLCGQSAAFFFEQRVDVFVDDASAYELVPIGVVFRCVQRNMDVG